MLTRPRLCDEPRRGDLRASSTVWPCPRQPTSYRHWPQPLVRYQERIGTRWLVHDVTMQAILTIAWLEGGHTYRALGACNGVPKSTCRTLVQEGIKVLARRALALTEVVNLARKAGWDYLIADNGYGPSYRRVTRLAPGPVSERVGESRRESERGCRAWIG